NSCVKLRVLRGAGGSRRTLGSVQEPVARLWWTRPSLLRDVANHQRYLARSQRNATVELGVARPRWVFSALADLVKRLSRAVVCRTAQTAATRRNAREVAALRKPARLWRRGATHASAGHPETITFVTEVLHRCLSRACSAACRCRLRSPP